MELIMLFLFFGIFILLLSKGVSVDPVNPYMVLFSSMILFLIAVTLIAEGVEVPTGETTVQLNMSVTQINGTFVDVQEVPTGLRTNSFNLILLLISLYLVFFGVGVITDNKYGAGHQR